MLSPSLIKQFCSSRLVKGIPPWSPTRSIASWYKEQGLEAQFGPLIALCSATHPQRRKAQIGVRSGCTRPHWSHHSRRRGRACTRCVLLRPHLVVTMVNLQLTRVIKFRARHITAAPSDHEALFRADLLRPSPWPRRLYRSAPS